MSAIEMIELGDTVVDTVTGLRGIVVCESHWVYGYVRIAIQPPMVIDGKDGKVPGPYVIDKPRARLISKRGAEVPIREDVIVPPADDPSYDPRLR